MSISIRGLQPVLTILLVAGVIGTSWFAIRAAENLALARRAQEGEREAKEELSKANERERELRESEREFRQMAAAHLMREAHYKTTLTEQDLTGHIRKGKHKVPVVLYRRKNNIQFQFLQTETKVWRPFHVRHGLVDSRQLDLLEMKDGKTSRFPDEELGEAIEGTDITYEDLAMPFLHWPRVSWQGSAEVKGQDCWVVRAENPGTAGNYALVIVSIHKKTHGLMQVVGYNQQGKALKRMRVTDIIPGRETRLINVLMGRQLESFAIRAARFDSYDPVTNKTVGISYLEFEKPKRSPRGKAVRPDDGPRPGMGPPAERELPRTMNPNSTQP